MSAGFVVRDGKPYLIVTHSGEYTLDQIITESEYVASITQLVAPLNAALAEMGEQWADLANRVSALENA